MPRNVSCQVTLKNQVGQITDKKSLDIEIIEIITQQLDPQTLVPTEYAAI